MYVTKQLIGPLTSIVFYFLSLEFNVVHPLFGYHVVQNILLLLCSDEEHKLEQLEGG